MVKKEVFKKINSTNHPIYLSKRTFGEKAADRLTKWAGSWTFILTFIFFLIVWIIINGIWLLQYKRGNPFDPYPFILLNLILSCLAAFQAPVILMSQNRQAQKDRIKAEYDYQVNRKAEREIREIKSKLDKILDKKRK